MSDNYLDFDLLIARADERYRATVTASPVGTAAASFSAPFTDQELAEFLQQLSHLEDQAAAQEAIKRFGTTLFRAVFSREIYSLWKRSIDKASQHVGLRLRLRLTDTPELAGLPWEYLFDESEQRFLALSSRTPVVHYLELARPPQRLQIRGPLPLLVLISSPDDYVRIDADKEWQNLSTSLKDLVQSKTVVVSRLVGEEANLFALQRLLQQEEIHVLHFIGDGGFDDQEVGCLLLQGEEGRGHWVSGEILKDFLEDQKVAQAGCAKCLRGRASFPQRSIRWSGTDVLQIWNPSSSSDANEHNRWCCHRVFQCLL